MKIKDIKNSLKNEQKQIGVPDVLARAKKAPINKLLDGQTPLRAFDKRFTLRLLWGALILLVTIILCFAVFMLMPSGTAKTTYAYMNITIQSGECADVYGLVVNEESKVVVLVHESGIEQDLPSTVSMSNDALEYTLKELYDAKTIDKVRVCVFCSSDEAAQNALDVARDAFDDLFGENDVEDKFEARIANDSDKAAWLEIVANGVTEDASIDGIVEAYLDKFLQA